MYFSHYFEGIGWDFVIDIFANQSAVKFTWKPKFFWEKDHRGVHWFTCCCCIER